MVLEWSSASLCLSVQVCASLTVVETNLLKMHAGLWLALLLSGLYGISVHSTVAVDSDSEGFAGRETESRVTDDE